MGYPEDVNVLPPSDPHELLRGTLEELRRLPGLQPGARVVAAMSGGIDSSVMAALLHRAGFEVIGISMHLFDKGGQGFEGGAAPRCCTLDDFQDARKVAYHMGFAHYVMNFEAAFKRDVIDAFIASYRSGETPSPCILCNQHLKFDSLLRVADEMEATHVATGHYARILQDAQGFHLLKASDAAKDQSYFLFSHTQATMARTLFPLEKLRKAQVRVLAQALGLHLAEKAESQEICFVTQGRYDRFIEASGAAPALGPGPIRHMQGRVMGSHDGFWRYTIGQRKGLGVAHAEPLYVIRLDPESNTVWVGEQSYLFKSRFDARDVSWCGAAPEDSLRCSVKLRSRSVEVPALVERLPDGRVHVELEEPQRAVTPGQAVVFYQGDEVLGGGWITRTP